MTVRFKGFLDEAYEFPDISQPIKGRLDIDLLDLDLMNSTGSRNWVMWIKSIRASEGIFLHNCPPQFISHASILVGLIPAWVTVQSFFVPYFCESCGASERTRHELGKDFMDFASLKVRDQIVCPVCSASMRLDVMKDSFLRFLSKAAA